MAVTSVSMYFDFLTIFFFFLLMTVCCSETKYASLSSVIYKIAVFVVSWRLYILISKSCGIAGTTFGIQCPTVVSFTLPPRADGPFVWSYLLVRNIDERSGYHVLYACMWTQTHSISNWLLQIFRLSMKLWIKLKNAWTNHKWWWTLLKVKLRERDWACSVDLRINDWSWILNCFSFFT